MRLPDLSVTVATETGASIEALQDPSQSVAINSSPPRMFLGLLSALGETYGCFPRSRKPLGSSGFRPARPRAGSPPCACLLRAGQTPSPILRLLVYSHLRKPSLLPSVFVRSIFSKISQKRISACACLEIVLEKQSQIASQNHGPVPRLLFSDTKKRPGKAGWASKAQDPRTKPSI